MTCVNSPEPCCAGVWMCCSEALLTRAAINSGGFESTGRFFPYFFVNSSAFLQNFLWSFAYSSARSAQRRCSGWVPFPTSVRDWITRLVLVSGFQFSALIPGRETRPFSSMLGWWIFVLNVIFGDSNGYSARKLFLILKDHLSFRELSCWPPSVFKPLSV